MSDVANPKSKPIYRGRQFRADFHDLTGAARFGLLPPYPLATCSVVSAPIKDVPRKDAPRTVSNAGARRGEMA